MSSQNARSVDRCPACDDFGRRLRPGVHQCIAPDCRVTTFVGEPT